MIKYALKDLISVGKLFKSTGVKGEIIGEIIPSLEERISELDYIFIEINGQSLPYFIEHAESNGNIYFKFEGINAPEQAHLLINRPIYLDKDKLSELEVDVVDSHESLIGFKLTNKGDLVGVIAQIAEYPGQDVFVIKGQKETIIPVVDQWIMKIDAVKKVVEMDFPQELLNLND